MTADERFQANLALVATKSPGLAEQLQQFPLAGIHLLPGPTGHLDGRLWSVQHQAWVPLCNPQDPLGEARHDVDALYTPHAKLFVLFGLGLGYFAVEFARRLRPYQRLEIFDCNPHCFKAAMYAVDMAPIMGERPVNTHLGDALPQVLQHMWLSLQSHEKFHIAEPIRSGYTQYVDAPLYEQLSVLSMDMIRYHHVGLATWAQFGPLIGDNDLENLPEFCTTPGLQELAGCWEGKPAVCIAAGPSLPKNLMLLTDPVLRNKVAVLTVGTMYATVRACGIIPDIVTTIDFQRLNWTDQFQGVPLDPRCTLVYLHSTYPQTVRRWPGPRFVGLNSSDTTEWLRHYAEPKAQASQVQTVAHLNVVMALLMGACPIVLIGQDLSMSGQTHHAPGALAQDIVPQDNLEAHVNADDIYGQPCYTRHSLLSMRTVFSQFAAANPDRIINCTEGGLHIEGIPDMPLRTVLEPLPSLLVAEPPLRTIAAARFEAYRPQTRWEDLTRDLSALEQKIVQATAWALRTQERQAHRLAVGNATERAAVTDALLASEAEIGALNDAVALIAVRRFDLIAAMAAIPPDPETTTAEALQDFHCTRLVTLATVLLETVPVVTTLVRRTRRRLADVAMQTPPTSSQLLRMFARQSYASVARWLGTAPQTWPGNGQPLGEPMRDYARLHAALAYAQQQYSVAAVLLTTWDVHPQRRARCYQALDAHAMAMQAAVQAYVCPSMAGIPTTPSASVALGEGATGPPSASPAEPVAAG